MSSIDRRSYRLEQAAGMAPRIAAGKVLEVGSFRFPGSPEVEAPRDAEPLRFIRVVVLRTLKGGNLQPGQELRIFSSIQWFRVTHASLLRDGVLSYSECRYSGDLPSEPPAPGAEVIFFLGDEPAPAGFPPGAAFSSMEGAFDRGDREAAVLKALAEGPYGDFDHRIVLSVGGRVRLPDGLEVRLDGHSHKRPMTGGPLCESTHVAVSHQGRTGKLQLNHVTDPEGTESWAQQDWGAFRIELHGMAYNVSSEIVVRKA